MVEDSLGKYKLQTISVRSVTSITYLQHSGKIGRFETSSPETIAIDAELYISVSLPPSRKIRVSILLPATNTVKPIDNIYDD